MITREQAAKAVAKQGSKSAAARALGVTRNVLRGALERAPARKAGAKESDAKALAAKVEKLEEALAAERKRKLPTLPKARPAKAQKSRVRVVVPDSHGAHIDWDAAKALIRDVAQLQPDQIVLIGDHLDCGGTFSAHQRNYTHEMVVGYDEDVTEANRFLDLLQQAAPGCRDWRYLEGNHEQHIERWAARSFESFSDAKFALSVMGPEAVLKLRDRGIQYYRMSGFYDGLTTRGMIKLGKCHFSHGWKAGQHATSSMLHDVGGNLVHGHTHRAASAFSGTTTSYLHGAWCPGTIAQRHPLYRHTAPSNWTTGYIVQFEQVGTGTFTTFEVPIFGDRSLLIETVNTIAGRAK